MLPPVSVLDEAGLAQIEENAETVLSQAGIAFRGHPRALELWRDAGADVDGELVRFPRGMCRQIVQENAPSSYVQHARNPARSVSIGGDSTVFAPNYGSPFVTDLDEGRRYATLEDFENIVKLVWMLPHLHHSGGTVCEPVDVPVNKRHLDMVYAHLRYSDKPIMGSVTADRRAADSVELCRIAFGGDLAGRTVLTSLINAASPMRWGWHHARSGGDLREQQSGVHHLAVHPGRGDVTGDRGGSGRPGSRRSAVGNGVLPARATWGSGDLRHVRVVDVDGFRGAHVRHARGGPRYLCDGPSWPAGSGCRSDPAGQLTSSKAPDAQASYESAMTLLPTMLAGVNFVLHAAGWIEGGLALSYEKLLMDADQLSMMEVYGRGVDMSPNGQALDALLSNEHGSHFLGHAHTLANFETAFCRSSIADNNSFEQWYEEGSLSAAQRANAQWKKMLADYEAPPIDEAADEEMSEYIARRKAEEPDALV